MGTKERHFSIYERSELIHHHETEKIPGGRWHEDLTLALADALERLSVLLSDFPQIIELDLNPINIFTDGRELAAINV